MRRALPAIILTLIGLGVLAMFKSSPGVPASQATTATTSTPADASGSATTTSPPATGGPPASGTAPPGGSASRTVNGDPVDNQYGTVQVSVTLHGNTITDVTPLQMPQDRRRSAFISEQAGPYLRQEVLQAQSAQIDIVSGATFTSQSYAQSLQSALSKAGV
jgi:uncharacterized protein with FMN-binding domain